LEQFEIAVSVSFSHAQVDPQVEALDDAAVIELPGLEIVHLGLRLVLGMTSAIMRLESPVPLKLTEW